MRDQGLTRREIIRAGVTVLAAGTAGCEGILSEETPTRSDRWATPTGRSTTASVPSPSSTQTGGTPATPTERSTPPPPPTVTNESGLLTEISPEDSSSGDLFGYSTAIEDGTAFVGAPGSDVVCVFEQSDSGWRQVATLTPAAEDSDDAFGASVAVDGDTLVVGAPTGTANGTRSGAAYVFERTEEAWSQTARVVPETPIARARFGIDVTLVDGGTVVGASNAIDPNGTRSGAAYAFDRTEEGWTQAATLALDDGAQSDEFGVSLANAAGTLFVGTYGADSVSVFERSSGTWDRTVTLVPGTGNGPSLFGADVTITGDTALVSAPTPRGWGGESGPAYVAEPTSDGWQATSGLLPSAATDRDGFGTAVALADDTALVGAARPTGTSSVYVFDLANGTWRQDIELVPDPDSGNAAFGDEIATADGTALIGAPNVVQESGTAVIVDIDAL